MTPQTTPSAWALLLSGLSQTALGAGLLLGQAAQLVERRAAATSPPRALATPLPLTELAAATRPRGDAL